MTARLALVISQPARVTHAARTDDGRIILTSNEAAAYLRISPRHLRTLVAHGNIPRLTYTRPYTFFQGDLADYAATTRVEGDRPRGSG